MTSKRGAAQQPDDLRRNVQGNDADETSSRHDASEIKETRSPHETFDVASEQQVPLQQGRDQVPKEDFTSPQEDSPSRPDSSSRPSSWTNVQQPSVEHTGTTSKN